MQTANSKYLPRYGNPPNPAIVAFANTLSKRRAVELHQLQVGYGVALAVMAVVSGVLGWLVAGRALAPLRTITATAERISETNLSERLSMAGPRDELRTPLAMMRTTLDVAIAKPGGVPAQTRELDAELRVDLNHADGLLEGFLTLARAQGGRLDEHERVALEPLIAAALTARADQLTARSLTVETHLAAVDDESRLLSV